MNVSSRLDGKRHVLFLPGRKHASKLLFAHTRFVSEEFMLLCGLQVRALFPGVAPGLAFDNSELTGAILPFFTLLASPQDNGSFVLWSGWWRGRLC